MDTSTAASSGASTMPAPRWPWALLALALVWVALMRVPLVLNAEAHLDSDLAVDGLTLREAVAGHWRWHYPGTPHMGTIPVLLSLPQALAFGVGPMTLVSGGTIANQLLVTATFLLAWRGFGPRVAAWSLVPMAFSSTGVVWLSGRITGGHLLTAFWQAASLLMMVIWLERGGRARAGSLGLWLGLGLYLDRMSVFTVVAVAVGLVTARRARGWSGGEVWAALLGAAVGLAPIGLGRMWGDHHDAYGAQFVSIFRPIDPRHEGAIDWAQAQVLAIEHVRILGEKCLPRLMSGHLLPDLASVPPSHWMTGQRRLKGPGEFEQLVATATMGALVLFAVALGALGGAAWGRSGTVEGAVSSGLLASSALVFLAFIVNRNIFDSDNYRYLVLLLVAWPIGFGRLFDWMTTRLTGYKLSAAALALMFAVVMTLDTVVWYRQFGWVKGALPARVVPWTRAAVDWLNAHPEVDAIRGDYWDIYRLAFLVERPLRVVPPAGAPNRYPESGSGVRPRTVVGLRRPGRYPSRFQMPLWGSTIRFRAPGVLIQDWPEAPGRARSPSRPAER